MITSHKNTGKIDSVITENNQFCNIWKDVNFTEAWPGYNSVFATKCLFMHILSLAMGI